MDHITYTVINHAARIKLGLTLSEYCVADLIYHLANNPDSKFPGWCYASKETIADMFGLTKRGVNKIIERLIERDLVKRNPEQSSFIKVTVDWYTATVINREQSSHPGTKGIQSGNKVPKDREQSSHYNNIDNNNYNKLAEPQKTKSSKNVDNSELLVEKRYENEGASLFTTKPRGSNLTVESVEQIIAKKQMVKDVRAQLYAGNGDGTDPIKTAHQAYGMEVLDYLKLPPAYTARIMSACKNKPLHIIQQATRSAKDFRDIQLRKETNIMNVYESTAKYFFKVLHNNR